MVFDNDNKWCVALNATPQYVLYIELYKEPIAATTKRKQTNTTKLLAVGSVRSTPHEWQEKENRYFTKFYLRAFELSLFQAGDQLSSFCVVLCGVFAIFFQILAAQIKLQV